MPELTLIIELLTLASILIAGIIFKAYAPSYIKEKAKNLATKEDVAHITKEVERIKSEHHKELEEFKSDVWKQQQIFLWEKENNNIRIQLFREAITTIKKYSTQVQNTSFMSLNMDACQKLSSMEELSSEARNYYSAEYESYRVKASESLTNYDELSVKIDELAIMILMYFGESCAEKLSNIRKTGTDLFSSVMPKTETENLIATEYNQNKSISAVRDALTKAHVTACQKFEIHKDAKIFFDSIMQELKPSS